MKSKIIIAGSGGIGKAAGLILANQAGFDCEIYFGDRYQEAADGASQFVHDGVGKNDICSGFIIPSEGLNDEMKAVFEKGDIILDCLPGSLAPRFAQYAKDFGMHYANLTEYVNETNQVTEIAKDAETGFILQTGLAPGFINVLAMKLFNSFCSQCGVKKVDSVKMNVGALSDNAMPPYFYAFTWSPIGVATEYVKDAIAVRDYVKQDIPSLSDTKAIIIDGVHFEEDFTSGGAADLPEALAGRVKDLDYQTLRHPGHYGWAKNIIAGASEGQDQIQHLEKVMLDTIPSVEDDVVIVYASVTGKDDKGVLRSIEKSYTVRPVKVGTKTLRAIQTTTASALCEAARMLLTNNYKGAIFQSDINPDEFLNGMFVRSFYGEFE